MGVAVFCTKLRSAEYKSGKRRNGERRLRGRIKKRNEGHLGMAMGVCNSSIGGWQKEDHEFKSYSEILRPACVIKDYVLKII